jgi:hypothetical protein
MRKNILFAFLIILLLFSINISTSSVYTSSSYASYYYSANSVSLQEADSTGTGALTETNLDSNDANYVSTAGGSFSAGTAQHNFHVPITEDVSSIANITITYSGYMTEGSGSGITRKVQVKTDSGYTDIGTLTTSDADYSLVITSNFANYLDDSGNMFVRSYATADSTFGLTLYSDYFQVNVVTYDLEFTGTSLNATSIEQNEGILLNTTAVTTGTVDTVWAELTYPNATKMNYTATNFGTYSCEFGYTFNYTTYSNFSYTDIWDDGHSGNIVANKLGLTFPDVNNAHYLVMTYGEAILNTTTYHTRITIAKDGTTQFYVVDQPGVANTEIMPFSTAQIITGDGGTTIYTIGTSSSNAAGKTQVRNLRIYVLRLDDIPNIQYNSTFNAAETANVNNGWGDAAGDTEEIGITPATSGNYLIIGTAMVASGSTSSSGSWRLNINNGAEFIPYLRGVEATWSFSRIEDRSTAERVNMNAVAVRNLTGGSTHSIKMQYADIDTTATADWADRSLIAIRLSDAFPSYKNSSWITELSTTSTTFQNITNITIDAPGDYWLLGSSAVRLSSTSYDVNMGLQHNGVVYGFFENRPKDTYNYLSQAFFANLTASSGVASMFFARDDATGTAYAKNTELVMLNMSSYYVSSGTFNCSGYTDDSSCSANSQCSWTYTPTSQYTWTFNDTSQSGQYLVSWLYGNLTEGVYNSTYVGLDFNVTSGAPPEIPPSLSISSVMNSTTHTSININWTTVGNYTNSTLFRDTIAIYEGTEKNFTDTGLSNNTGYTYNITVRFNSTLQNSTVFTIITNQTPCANDIQNSTATAWVNETVCQWYSLQEQNRTYEVYDANYCGNVTNTTIVERQNATCDQTMYGSTIYGISWNTSSITASNTAKATANTTQDIDTMLMEIRSPSGEYTNYTAGQVYENRSSLSYCYQEAANHSVAGDGSCSQNYGGEYNCTGTNCKAIYNDLWNNGVSETVHAWLKYQKPSAELQSAIFTWKNTDTIFNVTVDSTCLSYDPDYVFIYMNATVSYVKVACKNSSTTYVQIDDDTDTAIFEEAMYWGVATYSMTPVNKYEINLTSPSTGTYNLTRVWANLSTRYSNSSYVNLPLTVTGASTCVCPSTDTNWAIDLSENCVIESTCDIGTGNITFINTGTIIFNATITAKGIGGLPDNQRGYLGINARVWKG